MIEQTGTNILAYQMPSGDLVEFDTLRKVVRFNRWECALELEVPSVAGHMVNGNSLSFGNFQFLPALGKPPFNEGSGYDLIITLPVKPPTNQIVFNYNKTLISAYLQPPLNQERKIGGRIASLTETDAYDADGKSISHRPDYVVNSIALYHEAKGGMVTSADVNRGLTTGQIGFLYRMKATDAQGRWVWANWSLDSGKFILTIPQSFLNTAVYPVLIVPAGDFMGYTTAGGSTELLDATWYLADKLTDTRAATAGDVITAYSAHGKYHVDSQTMGIDVYTFAGGVPVTRLGTASTITFNNSTVDWKTVTGLSQTLAAATYTICTGAYPALNHGLDLSYNTVANSSSWHNGTGALPATWVDWFSTDYDQYRWSWYATYTPAAGGWTHIAKVHGVGAASIAKMNGVAVAAIGKISGVAV